MRHLQTIIFLAAMLAAAAASGEEQKVGEAFCEKANLGVTTAKGEVSLPDGARVDCVIQYPLASFAVEIDRSGKWAECIGQALLYGEDSKSNAVCALFQDSKTSDKSFAKHTARARRVITLLKNAGIKISLFCIKTDGEPQKCEE